MKNIKEEDSTFLIAVSSIFAIATIAVIWYTLAGTLEAVYVALGSYALGFAVLALSSIRKLFIIANYNERLKKYEDEANLKEEQNNFISTKDNIQKVLKTTKVKEICRAIFGGVFAIFTIIVLVLF